MPAISLRRLPTLLTALLLAACVAAPAAAAADTAPPAAIALETGWQFKFDPGNVGLGQRWPDWSETWAGVEVPHVFDPNPTNANFLGTIGWYRLKFDTPATPAGFTLGAALRGRPAGRARLAQRPPRRSQHRPLRAVHGSGAWPAHGRQAERARRPRPEHPAHGPARRLVELGRDRAAGHAGPDRPRRVARPRRALRRRVPPRRHDLRRDRAHRRHGSSTTRPRRSDPLLVLQMRSPSGAIDARRPCGCATSSRASAGASASRPASGARRSCGRRCTPTSTRPCGSRASAARSSRSTSAASGCATSASRTAASSTSTATTCRSARRVDPGGSARPRAGAARRRRRADRRRPQGARRQRDARAVPAQRAHPRAPRRGGHPGLEPGAGLPRGRRAGDAPRPPRGVQEGARDGPRTRATTRA